MRKHHRFLATGAGLALLLTTAASTTYAQPYTNSGSTTSSSNNWFSDLVCRWFPDYCKPHTDPVRDPVVTATPELDSLLLFGFGLTGFGGYAVTRFRARRRSG